MHFSPTSKLGYFAFKDTYYGVHSLPKLHSPTYYPIMRYFKLDLLPVCLNLLIVQ